MTSKKSILIVGTSHTAGECVDPKDNVSKPPGGWTTEGKELFRAKKKHLHRNWLKPEQRWWQGLREKYDVTTFCMPGASPQSQLYYSTRWLNDNPDLRFDGAVVEGRHPIPQSIAIPRPAGDNTGAEIDEYAMWLHEYPQNDIGFSFRLAFDSLARKDNLGKYQDWYEHYITSELSVTEVVASNIALCKLLETKCNRVAWISFTSLHSTDVSDRYLTYPLRKRWGINEIWPSYSQVIKKDGYTEQKYRCPCGHVNAEGNKIISDHITPLIEERLEL